MILHFLKKKLLILMAVFMPMTTMTSCSEETMEVISNVLDFLLGLCGYNMEDEHVEDQEDAVVYDDNTAGDLPSSVDLSGQFAPIGNQGDYGTCVAWATGYGLKTALDAKSKGYSATQLKNASYQCSAVDLWHLIPSSGKSTNCDGSNFEPALEAMMKNGCASMADVPFTNNKMKCDGVSGKGSSNKLNKYRVIAYSQAMASTAQGMNVANFKYYLAKGYPILIGAQLGERFMAWQGSSVISSDTKDYKGQHAYHAMVVTGYNNSKKAFRVRNSWGASWGDNGSIWVDENFFIKQFVFGGWIAWNDSKDAPSENSLSSAKLKSASANDLTAHVYTDKENADGTRTLTYNIENTGSSTISSSQNWSVVYMLFNAKNLNDKVILFHDAYTDKANGADYEGVATDPAENYATDVDLAAGQNVAKELGGKKMQFTYSIPSNISGNYYMVLIANPFNSMDENNFQNNYCFVSGHNAIPLTIQNGKIMNMPSSLSDQRSILTATNHNTYSGNELLQMLALYNEHGVLKQQVNKSTNTLRSAKQLKKIVK